MTASARFRVVHRSSYRFAPGSSVHLALSARLTPRSSARQHVEHHQLVVRPLPRGERRSCDGFGNERTECDLEGEFGALDVTAVSTVALLAGARHEPAELEPWERVARCTAQAARADRMLAKLIEPGGRAALPVEGTALAREAFTPGRPFGEALVAFVALARERMRFVRGATHADSTATDFLAQGGGVCQDFAHYTLGCVRALGFAARYASGYVTGGRMPGSHAWTEVWQPRGWIEVDTTLGRVGPLGHVLLGYGRDYDDVAPLRGTFAGTCARVERFEVAVSVRALPS